MQISREESVDLMGDRTGFEINGKLAKEVHSKRHGPRRWLEAVTTVISYDGKFYSATCDVPLTEQQEGSGYWEEQETVEWKEVFAKEKTIIVYE